ncbi:hypothetical protein L228DRAFT_237903 [Xylona heveae TC161]|uniref:NAD(P)-binding domain-containing protein n=1 Tax=Xylona heveae (strain CBS 132557 / TC161) TaxID=1328760 RepID=A0A165HD23_XYLHT|nr:hypothetical protein L228DRAFT_237903 [Xylona heveae TC161]KZF23325.1 hypothetical protein L228DRAFT_237903 [Xylona heveae TC161]
MSTSNKPTIAVFGATGGCVGETLRLSLTQGYKSRALVRSSSKLQKLLLAKGVGQKVIDTNLSIIEGNVKDVNAVRETLQANDGIVDVIISGVGGIPKFTPNPLRPTLDDPHICEDAMNKILEAISTILTKNPSLRKPLLAAISTTGTTDFRRDVPVLMLPLYHWLLPIPHADKRAMEDAMVKASSGDNAPLGGFVVVRASLLTDGASKGTQQIRVGWELPDGSGEGPAIGYTISRSDVGGWLFEKLVATEHRDEWAGKLVTLTY